MKKKMVLCLVTICSLIVGSFCVPFMSEVQASNSSIEQYVKTQSYLGDKSDIYYSDLKGERNPYVHWTITPKSNKMVSNIGYYISDLDSDGQDELLTLSLNSNYEPVLSLNELENGSVVKKDSVVINNTLRVDNNLYWDLSEAMVEHENLNMFVFPMNGKTYIGIEEKTKTENLASGIGYAVATFIYENGKLNLQYADSSIGSMWGYEDCVEMNNKLRSAGFDFDIANVLFAGIDGVNINYSDYISGSKKICGLRQRATYTNLSLDEWTQLTGRDYTENYCKIVFYNLGNTNPTNDGTMYRMYNKNSGEHFYTGNAYEKSNLICISWDYEGVAWKAPQKSDSPVYRFYNPYSGEHHYTLDTGEKDYLSTVGWNYEGIGWYSDDSKDVALYRLFNPNATGQYAPGAHHYTKDMTEVNYLTLIGWNYEGIGWYGL